MNGPGTSWARTVLIWAGLIIATAVPIAAATASPLLAWREPVYITAGFAGIIAMVLMLVQPLLVAGYLPGLSKPRGRLIHLWIGSGMVLAVVLHVAGLWITSPPDVVDALLLASPTPFSVWGVIAMWAVFAAAFIAVMRNRLKLLPRTWRRTHTTLTSVVIVGTVLHAMLIEGAMETISKTALCLLVVAAGIKALCDLKVWKLWWSPQRRDP